MWTGLTASLVSNTHGNIKLSVCYRVWLTDLACLSLSVPAHRTWTVFPCGTRSPRGRTVYRPPRRRHLPRSLPRHYMTLALLHWTLFYRSPQRLTSETPSNHLVHLSGQQFNSTRIHRLYINRVNQHQIQLMSKYEDFESNVTWSDKMRCLSEMKPIIQGCLQCILQSCPNKSKQSNHNWWVSEQFLNGTSAQLKLTNVPLTAPRHVVYQLHVLWLANVKGQLAPSASGMPM